MEEQRRYDHLKSAVTKLLSDDELPLPTSNQIRNVISEYRTASFYRVSDELAEKMARELETSLGITMDIGSVITEKGYVEWLTSAKAKIEPYYWERYRELLENKHFPPKVLAKLDEVTDKILGLLGNPKEDGPWDRRGMVVGHVQSGKTANYTGLICKAADAGYRLVVVIAGIHNNLRNQTQQRIDEGFIGKDSGRLVTGKENRYIGVGKIDTRNIPVSLTSSLRDFNKREAETNAFELRNLNVPVVLVIKKNTSTLKNLVNWLKEHNARGGTQLIDAPMLLIDDEADNASIDISKPKEEASRINSQIRELLQQFHRSCYIGYTATPFANIFIDPSNEHEMLGADLFPRNFIVGLDAPDNYFGANKIFSEESNIIRTIDDNEDLIPVKHKNQHELSDLPNSLKISVRTFILCRSIRMLRGNKNTHNSMLVNASRFTSVQSELRNSIHGLLGNIVRHIRFNFRKEENEALKDEEISALHEAWQNEYSNLEFKWNDIQPTLLDAAAPISVIEVNSKSAGKLNYSDHPEGLNVIAVGGFSLSRGFTLEGLSISYFLRNSIMYDTLLQMGRWFGYRQGYEDLCRIWMSQEAVGWYGHIAESIEELRDEIRKMQKQNRTPRDFGLKVRSHPDSLIVTARNKMGSSKNVPVKIGLGNQFIETSILAKNPKIIEANRNVARKLVSDLGTNSYDMSMPKGNYLWQKVDAKVVMDFISGFTNHKNSLYTESGPVVEYINQRADNELKHWDVAIISTTEGQEDDILGLLVKRQNRTESKRTLSKTDYLIVTEKQRIADAAMEAIGLEEHLVETIKSDFIEEQKARTKREGKPPRNGRYTIPGRKYREHRKTPLLIIHLLTINKPKAEGELREPSIDKGVVGWSISFPETQYEEKTVEYIVNTTWWKENYGDDFDDESLEDE
ncbi:MAG: Z1 domain-containing protein [Pseudomonadota bacterium]|nr:Z1 domain-containing protein [Pseudomonadota bacterium]